MKLLLGKPGLAFPRGDRYAQIVPRNTFPFAGAIKPVIL